TSPNPILQPCRVKKTNRKQYSARYESSHHSCLIDAAYESNPYAWPGARLLQNRFGGRFQHLLSGSGTDQRPGDSSAPWCSNFLTNVSADVGINFERKIPPHRTRLPGLRPFLMAKS